jgi:hypothetical protein
MHDRRVPQHDTRKASGKHGPAADALDAPFDSTLHLSSGKMISIVLVLFAFVWIGWIILADTAADNAAMSDPQRALRWMPSEAIALDELADREIKKPDGNLKVARNLAERALQSDPIDARALFLLGWIAEKKGAPTRADALMVLSGARTWRDIGTQAWLVNRDIQHGQFEQALAHVDALVRIHPDFFEKVFPVLFAFTRDQRTLAALTTFLGAAPPWRVDFLAKLSSQTPDVGPLVQLYAGLENSPHPPNAVELRPYLDRLVKDGRFTQAYQSWLKTLPSPQRTGEVYPYNGDFASPIDGLPFNWLIRSVTGMDVQIVASSRTADGRALQLEFSGTRVAPFTLGQLLLLPPGEYRLTGMVKAEALRTQRGLAWQISCAESPGNTLASTDLVANAMPWTRFSVNFTIPAANCRGQWLNLAIPSRTASERQIEGQIWYEQLHINNTVGTAGEGIKY